MDKIRSFYGNSTDGKCFSFKWHSFLGRWEDRVTLHTQTQPNEMEWLISAVVAKNTCY